MAQIRTPRGIQAALAFFHTGVYHSSRLPGNPLYEYVLTLIVPWAGGVGANLFSVMCYGGCVHAFWLLAPAARGASVSPLSLR